jgi:hypothetical protein
MEYCVEVFLFWYYTSWTARLVAEGGEQKILKKSRLFEMVNVDWNNSENYSEEAETL